MLNFKSNFEWRWIRLRNCIFPLGQRWVGDCRQLPLQSKLGLFLYPVSFEAERSMCGEFPGYYWRILHRLSFIYIEHIYICVCAYIHIYIHRSLFMLQILFKAYTQNLMYTLIHAEGLVFCFSLFLCIWVMHRSSETARRNTVQQRWVLQHYNINVRPPNVFKSPIPTLVAVWC